MRTILVFGDKTFKLTIPAEARLTFAPWSPPPRDGRGWDQEAKSGTLRIYEGAGEKSILAVFAGVRGFRDTSLDYMEEVAVQKGATIWSDDAGRYTRDSNFSEEKAWVVPELGPPE